MQLTATEITLPNDEWKIQSFKEVKSLSEETMCFSAILVHVPTKAKFTLRNDGHGGSSFMNRYDYTKPESYVVAEKAWAEFVEACRPVLQDTIKDEGELYGDLYLTADFHLLEDSVINLFTEEASVRKSLTKSVTNACVRYNDYPVGEFEIYNVSPEVLKKSGKNFGKYWDRALDNWVNF